MNKFLQGKWIADEVGEYVFTRMPEGCLIPVAQMRSWGYLTGIGGAHLSSDEAIEIQKANARLIAAAPEMYRLLKVWTQIGAEPTLKNARKQAEELLVRIDGKQAKDDCD